MEETSSSSPGSHSDFAYSSSSPPSSVKEKIKLFNQKAEEANRRVETGGKFQRTPLSSKATVQAKVVSQVPLESIAEITQHHESSVRHVAQPAMPLQNFAELSPAVDRAGKSISKLGEEKSAIPERSLKLSKVGEGAHDYGLNKKDRASQLQNVSREELLREIDRLRAEGSLSQSSRDAKVNADELARVQAQLAQLPDSAEEEVVVVEDGSFGIESMEEQAPATPQDREKMGNIVTEMHTTEATYLNGLRSLVPSKGPSVLKVLAKLSKNPEDQRALIGLHNAIESHAKSVEKFSGQMDAANRLMAAGDHEAALAVVEDTYSRMDVYSEGMFDCATQFEPVQAALRNIKEANLKGYAKIEAEFRANNNRSFINDFSILSVQRMPRHLMLLKSLNINPAVSPDVKANLKQCEARADAFAQDLDTQLPYSQEVHNQATAPDPDHLEPNSVQFFEAIANPGGQHLDQRDLFLYGAGAVWGDNGAMKGVDAYEQLNRAYKKSSPEGKIALLELVKDHLELGASLPLTPQGMQSAKGHISYLIQQAVGEGNLQMRSLAADISKLAHHNLNVREHTIPAKAVGEQSEVEDLSAALSGVSQHYNLSNVPPGQLYQDIHDTMRELVVKLNLSELDNPKPGSPLNPTLNDYTRFFNAGSRLLSQQILYANDPSKAHRTVLMALKVAYKEKDWGAVAVLKSSLENASVDRLKFDEREKNALMEAIQSETSGKPGTVVADTRKSLAAGAKGIPPVQLFQGVATNAGEISVKKQDGEVHLQGITDRLDAMKKMKTVLSDAIEVVKKDPSAPSESRTRFLKAVATFSNILEAKGDFAVEDALYEQSSQLRPIKR